MVEKADFYHLQSIRILLRVTSTIQDAISNGETLAAICLLRSFEIISRESWLVICLGVVMLSRCR